VYLDGALIEFNPGKNSQNTLNKEKLLPNLMNIKDINSAVIEFMMEKFAKFILGRFFLEIKNTRKIRINEIDSRIGRPINLSSGYVE
jgi:hypothetical protein